MYFILILKILNYLSCSVSWSAKILSKSSLHISSLSILSSCLDSRKCFSKVCFKQSSGLRDSFNAGK